MRVAVRFEDGSKLNLEDVPLTEDYALEQYLADYIALLEEQYGKKVAVFLVVPEFEVTNEVA